MEKVIVTNSQELESLIYNSVRKAIREMEPGKGAESDSEAFLSVAEASDFLNLAPQTIYGMTCKRKIPFFKQGKKIYFKRSDLIQWLESGRIQTQSELIVQARKMGV